MPGVMKPEAKAALLDSIKVRTLEARVAELEGTLAEREAWFEKCIAMWKQEEVMWKERETELLATLSLKWAGTKPE